MRARRQKKIARKALARPHLNMHEVEFVLRLDERVTQHSSRIAALEAEMAELQVKVLGVRS